MANKVPWTWQGRAEKAEQERDALRARAEQAEAEVARLTRERDEARAEIEAAWLGIEHGYDIEPRALIEAEAKTNGFRFGLAQAVHTIWKREPKAERDQRPTYEQIAKLKETPHWPTEESAGYRMGYFEALIRVLALYRREPERPQEETP